MAKGFQAVKFLILDFDDGWERVPLSTSYANIRYTATTDGARLAVVFEGSTGLTRTYRYQLAAGDEVFAVDQVVHVPARCMKEDQSNSVVCGDGKSEE